MENTIEVKKRSSESVIMWRVEAESLTPNTLLVPADGLTLIVTADHVTKAMAKKGFVNSLFNPGKGKKLMGGNKPYRSFDLVAIDQSSSFEAEWGLGGPTAIPAYDKEIGMECMAVAFGTYSYKIGDQFAFRNALQLDQRGAIRRDDVREFLRSETTGIIRSFLMTMIGNKDWKEWPVSHLTMLDILKDKINEQLDSKGLEVTSFSISKLSYDPKHQAVRERVGAAKAEVYIKKIENTGRRDDVDVDSGYVGGVVVPYLNAQKGGSSGRNSDKDEPVFILCPRCRTKNPASANYCSVCQEKLK